MVDFKETEMRKMCRNPKCRMKLPTPISNEKEAFCCKGCYGSFYLHRCIVCEKAIERTTANRKICKKSKCRNALAAGEGFGRYHADSARPSHVSPNLERKGAEPIESGTFEGHKPARRWRIIAGPALTPSQFHCATVPDGEIVDGKLTWDGGSYERIETQNRRLLDQHFASKQTKPIDSSIWNMCAACGREDDLVDHKVMADGWITFCCECRSKWVMSRQIERLEREARFAELMAEIPDDLSIPPRLDRRPKPELRQAA